MEKKKHPIIKKILIFFIFLLLIFILIYLYGYFIGNSGLKVKEYKIVNKNIPTEFYGLKIVHISDIHYGKHFDKNKLQKVVDKINEINPDIVVLTGDLIDNKTNDKQTSKDLITILSQINSTINKYAISGNHDYNFKNWKKIITNSGFINLDDNYDIIYGKKSKIMISGISTNYYDSKKVNQKLSLANEYLKNNDVNYKILLIHEPDYISKIKNNDYNLILSGHSHDGQIKLPFIGALYTPNGSKKYYKNYYNINNSQLYISSGLGTTSFHIRLFNKPSINFYRLVNK